jgi:uncharacterized repeat protein (TIGR01451 family)
LTSIFEKETQIDAPGAAIMRVLFYAKTIVSRLWLCALLVAGLMSAQTPTTTLLVSSPNPASLGQSVTLSATVTVGATGKVTFYDGVLVLGTAALAGGHASFSTVLLASGAHSLTAHYNGDTSFRPSLSVPGSQTVVAVPTNGFRPAKLDQTVGGSDGLVVADFNRDGVTDLAFPDTDGITIKLGKGDGTFAAGTHYPAGLAATYVLQIITGDFDSDGNTDIVMEVNIYDGRSAYLLRGNGDGTFQTTATAIVNLPKIILTQYAVDLNRDGQLDLLVIQQDSLSTYSLSIMLGNGDGTFQTPIPVVSNTSFPYVAVADLNSDGNADLVVSPNSVFLGNGDGTFQPALTLGSSVNNFTVGDFNGDGKIDILADYAAGTAVLLGNGDGSFQAPLLSVRTTNPLFYGGLTIGDFNGDGMLDFAYRADNGANPSSSLAIVFGNGDGTFQHGVSIPANSGGQLVIADFNGDGKPDLAAENLDTALNIYLGGQFSGLDITQIHAGPLTAGQTKIYQISVRNPFFVSTSGAVTVIETLPSGLTATAIGGQGWTCSLAGLTCTRSDVLTSVLSYPPILITVLAGPASTPGTLTVSGSVTSSGATSVVSDPTPLLLATATTLMVSSNTPALSQDIVLTATVSSGATGAVSFFDGTNFLGTGMLSGGSATLTTHLVASGARKIYATYLGDATHGAGTSPPVTLRVKAEAAGGLTMAASPATGSGLNNIYLADVNGDGKADLVTPNSAANTISVLLGNGDGTFQPKSDYAVGANPVAITIADFNQDGKPDLAVANQSYSRYLSILLNRGDGTFSSATNIAMPPGQYPANVLAADFDGNGTLDLVVNSPAAVGQFQLTLLLGNGDGTFQALPNVGTSCCSAALAAGDLNGDGNLDLVAGGYVYLGNGNGTFSNNGIFPGGLAPASWVLADLNSDGNLDLIAPPNPSYGFNGFYVFLGNGDGTFQAPGSYPTEGGTNTLAVADINGDGKLDVITANVGANSITIWFGAGDGTFRSSINYPSGLKPNGVVAADFNGDGRTDLAVSKGVGDSVTVLLGVLAPVLGVSMTHSGNFSPGDTGRTYTITVMNIGPAPPAGPINVTDTLPTGLSATAIGGSGWNCILATLTCTRADAVATGANYPTIVLTVDVKPDVAAQVTNVVMVSGSGAIDSSASDATYLLPAVPTLMAPANGSVSTSTTPILSWAPSNSAINYAVYFGTNSVAPPPLFLNMPTVQANVGQLSPGQTYYWRVVANNTIGSTTSPLWSFTTPGIRSPSKPGIFRSGYFWLEDVDGNQQFNSPPDRAFAFGGVAGDIPITGDWSGSGTTKVGIYRPSNGLFILDYNGNGVFDPGVDLVYNLGVGTDPTDVPVVGDWNGSGRTKVGLFRKGFFWILDTNGNGIYEQGVDATYAFGGVVGDVPVVGDWTGSGASKIGLFRLGFYWILDANGNGLLDSINATGGDQAFAFGGIAGDVPLVGDWNADGTSKVGVFRQGFFWVLDANGNHTFDGTGPGQDLAFPFGGISGDVPVAGRW